MESAMFKPAITANSKNVKPSGVVSRLTSPIPYLSFPTRLDPTDFYNVALMCALSCTGSGGSLTQWKSMILTYTNALFSELVPKLPKDVAEPRPVTQEELDHLRQVFQRAVQTETEAEDDTANPHEPDLLSTFTIGNILPLPANPINCGWFTYNRDPAALIAHYSLVVFLAGKQIDQSNRVAITVNRPRALIEKYRIENKDLLNGSLKMSDRAHMAIHQAWLEMTQFKSICFKEFATYTHVDTDLQQDIILTTVILMRHMQMQHAALIYKFLLSYPWAKDWPPLRKYISIYMHSLVSAQAVDEHLQPYIKIIWGDKSGLFPRKELLPLVACAVAAEEESTETLASYYHDDSFGSIVDAFKAKRDEMAESLVSGIVSGARLPAGNAPVGDEVAGNVLGAVGPGEGSEVLTAAEDMDVGEL